MSKTIAIPDDLYDKVAEHAAKDQVSVEQYLATLLATRMADREFIETRARLFGQADFERALNTVPDAEPDEYDRL